MRLLVIGQTVEDNYLQDGIRITAPGGIYYAAAALHQIKAPEDEIILCTSIEELNYHLYADVYDHYDRKYMAKIESIPKVWLTVNQKSERSERYQNITESLELDFDVEKYNGILLNMITGFDISIEQLVKLRSQYKGFIYLDVHSLSRGLDEDNNRIFRTIPDFERWARCADMIQVNFNELTTLAQDKNEQEIVNWLLSIGVKAVIITLDEKGVRCYYSHRGEMVSVFHSAIKVKTKNKIGCGDVFGAAFVYDYLKNKKLNSALNFANSAAGCIASYSEIKMIKNLKNDISRWID